MPASATAVLNPGLSLSNERARATRGTVISPRFDLVFFILPPLGTVLFVALEQLVPSLALLWCALVWVGLAQSHFGATGLFFFDRTSLEHYARSPLVYLVVPAGLVVAATAVGFSRYAPMTTMFVAVFSFWHGNRQSAGICGLYRGLTRSFDPLTRRLELGALFCAGAAFTSAGALRMGMLGADRARHLPPAFGQAWWALVALALSLLTVTMVRAWRQCRAASVNPWPRLSVLASSWAMYAPYLVAHSPLSAFLASLIPHYLQYHGLVYRVNHNKLGSALRPTFPWLRRIAATPWRYLFHTVGFALLLGSAVVAGLAMNRLEVALGLVAGVNLAHFWLDGFFWRFRDPRARAATLQFIQLDARGPVAKGAPAPPGA